MLLAGISRAEADPGQKHAGIRRCARWNAGSGDARAGMQDQVMRAHHLILHSSARIV
ncbi:hypothetical protein [Nocardia terpenica]|uniref:hypothetical protein n=1 Tax=Nocardia terpenica TaxID=455432 RepID=UPI000A52823A|nr:hypothetical protein [Nocardia terpenica]